MCISKFAYGKVENPLKLYRGEDCVEVFCSSIYNEARGLYHMFPEKWMKPLTCEQWRKYDKATTCQLCLKEFKEGNNKVRDHCHYSGKYRGPAHRNCSLRHKIPYYIPIVFHNLSRYDAHLFIRELGKKLDISKIGVIAENKEKYIIFNVDVNVDSYTDNSGIVEEDAIKIRFIDSFRFMVSILDSLMNNLVKDERKLSGFKDYSETQCELLIRKGVYPYEYMTSWNKFEETELPPKEAFYSNLNMSNISDQDYSHAQKVWKGFGI